MASNGGDVIVFHGFGGSCCMVPYAYVHMRDSARAAAHVNRWPINSDTSMSMLLICGVTQFGVIGRYGQGT
jgi:hypothetical protein